MNIKKLNEEFEKLLEMANVNCIGQELTSQNSNLPDDATIDDKVRYLVVEMEEKHIQEYKRIRGLKISNVFPFKYNNKSYNLCVCMGDTYPNTDKLLRTSQHGLYHMFKRNHWNRSKQALYELDNAVKYGEIQPEPDDPIGKARLIYIDNNKNKYRYIIGLAGNPVQNETVLVTCFKE